MSNFFIFNMAVMTRPDFTGGLSAGRSPKIAGTICQDTPNLSFGQPYACFSPPAESLAHSVSTSSCVFMLTKNEMAGVNLNNGPPFNA
jgi:hypothetical protein